MAIRADVMKTIRNPLKWFARVAMVASVVSSSAAIAGTITYYHNDLLGSPIVATNASGQVIWRENYRPYGERLTNDPNSSANKVWYTSRRHDVESGLVYMGARYYDPTVGRFMGVDPKVFDPANPHSFNRYAYGNNNPNKYIDPDGRSPLFLAIIGNVIGGAVIGGGVAGAVNAAMQFQSTGTVRWGGIGGMADAVGDGAEVGAVLGVFGAEYGGAAAGINAAKEAEAIAAREGIADAVGANLKKLHSEETIKSGSNRYSYDFWKGKSNAEILQSLKPGQIEALRVKPDGTVMNGNTRLQVLEERGIDTNKLPRENYGGS